MMGTSLMCPTWMCPSRSDGPEDLRQTRRRFAGISARRSFIQKGADRGQGLSANLATSVIKRRETGCMEGKLPPDGMDENPVSQSPEQEVGGSYKLIRVLGQSERRSAMVPNRTGIAWSNFHSTCTLTLLRPPDWGLSKDGNPLIDGRGRRRRMRESIGRG
jgi:hypothetical protein